MGAHIPKCIHTSLKSFLYDTIIKISTH